jgi:sugar lactone lactonase YvrE
MIAMFCSPLIRQLLSGSLFVILTVASVHAGSLYVTNELPNANSPSASSVSVYSLAPTFQNNLVPATPYYLPDAIVVDSARNVYVADAGGNRVVEFNAAGNQINVFNTDNLSAVSPSGLAIDPVGNVYVCSLDGVIQKISGGSVTNVGTVPGVTRAISYNPYNGLLYFTTQYPGNIYTMPASGGTATLFASGIGSGNLRGLAFGNGNLYVSDTSRDHNSGAIYMFNDGSSTASLFASGLPGPNYIAIDSSGRLFVAEYFGDDVVEFASNGTPMGQFIVGLHGPSGIALDPSASQTVVPEPSGWILFSLGGSLLIFGRAIRRRSSRPALRA